MASKRAQQTAATIRQIQIPHSWTMSRWTEEASHVAPGSTRKARYLFRMHKDELLIAGAVARVGREIIFFGAQYDRFLRRNASRVAGFKIAANRARSAA